MITDQNKTNTLLYKHMGKNMVPFPSLWKATNSSVIFTKAGDSDGMLTVCLLGTDG